MARLRGINFPMINAPDGFPRHVSPDDLFKQSIQQILLTRIGERVMLPEFGSRIPELIFENTGPELAGQIREEVIRAVSLWEPRVQINDVQVSFTDTQVKILIIFTVLNRVVEQEILLDRR